jgi:hypothetical protein
MEAAALSFSHHAQLATDRFWAVDDKMTLRLDYP